MHSVFSFLLSLFHNHPFPLTVLFSSPSSLPPSSYLPLLLSSPSSLSSTLLPLPPPLSLPSPLLSSKSPPSFYLPTHTGKLEQVGYYGLNWKSLCQPAILPSSTDFLVPLSELKDEGKRNELFVMFGIVLTLGD